MIPGILSHVMLDVSAQELILDFLGIVQGAFSVSFGNGAGLI